MRKLIHSGQLRASAIGGRRRLVAHRDWVRAYVEANVVEVKRVGREESAAR